MQALVRHPIVDCIRPSALPPYIAESPRSHQLANAGVPREQPKQIFCFIEPTNGGGEIIGRNILNDLLKVGFRLYGMQHTQHRD
ncbi:MAG TPA: hypothetical protein VFW87_10315 [Pirellulales bacterium]|nr:hypothetical protein [Pirellulales bacterium]